MILDAILLRFSLEINSWLENRLPFLSTPFACDFCFCLTPFGSCTFVFNFPCGMVGSCNCLFPLCKERESTKKTGVCVYYFPCARLCVVFQFYFETINCYM